MRITTLHRFKWLLLANAWWWALLGGFGVVVAWWPVKLFEDWRIALTLVGGLVSGAFLVQKQNLDELKLFHDLFREFNGRYDRLNQDLLDMLKTGSVSGENLQILIDYFNLCGEEYWWYRAGHIPHEVWRSWCRGMLQYLENERIRQHWDSEVSQDSYYGLTLEKIRSAARSRS